MSTCITKGNQDTTTESLDLELDAVAENNSTDTILGPDDASVYDRDGLNGIRIAVPHSMRDLGTTIVDDLEFESWKSFMNHRGDFHDDVQLKEEHEPFTTD
ncbi:hypothetical protein N7508_009344 [Penicillium antarcticum]|uniref:uncharacterized protein n=1 Tax=Penicillium antarcticum TaxID=416450 RepID=UPI00238A3FD1|nr:uncharacterized protein N7508_009344 [Penicillium antarcticum]KAJ5294523.1 hypothetical protein N7508_009344 [Penicillium antarcticum]